MDNKLLTPRSVTERNRLIQNFCIDKIKVGENASVVGMEGSGITINYEYVLEQIENNKSKFNIYSKLAKSDDDLKHLLSRIHSDPRSKIVVVCLSTGRDVSWFIKELNVLRDIEGTNFVSALFADIVDVRSALIDKTAILTKFIKFLKPLDLDDAKRLIEEFNRRFDFMPSEKYIKEIFKLSGGNISILKSLYFYLKEYKTFREPKELLNNFEIKTRTEKVLFGLTKSDIDDLTKGNLHNEILTNLGFLTEGKVFSTLLISFLKLNSNNDLDTSIMTVNELKTLNALKGKVGKMTDREELAKIIWEKDWEDKYSDWAIDQIIFRLREKLKKSNASFKIITKKGQGFILREK